MDTRTAYKFREPAVAGGFYPAAHDVLAGWVDAELAGAGVPAACPLAVIAPHAGFRFSGRLAAAALAATRDTAPATIAILSPSHRHAFDGIALPSCDAFRTPLGDSLIDPDAREALMVAGLVHINDAAHDREHGIEGLLPFLQRLHPAARIVPVVIGRCGPEAVSRVIDRLADVHSGPPLFVLSSDLSHYLPHDQAQVRDAATARLIETGRGTEIGPADACGATVISGFLAARAGQGARVRRIAMDSSHSVTGDVERTVGYGAWAFFPAEADATDDADRKVLLSLARQTLASRLRRGTTPAVDVASFANPLQTQAASFVTLTEAGRLRGCIGSLAPQRPLVADVVTNAAKSGFEDPRFRPITQDALGRTGIKIAVLSRALPMSFGSEADLVAQLVPGRDGLILSDGSHRGTFLPMVWDSLTEPGAFLSALKVKAGLPKDHWSDSLRVDRFCAETFAEPGAG